MRYAFFLLLLGSSLSQARSLQGVDYDCSSERPVVYLNSKSKQVEGSPTTRLRYSSNSDENLNLRVGGYERTMILWVQKP